MPCYAVPHCLILSYPMPWCLHYCTHRVLCTLHCTVYCTMPYMPYCACTMSHHIHHILPYCLPHHTPPHYALSNLSTLRTGIREDGNWIPGAAHSSEGFKYTRSIPSLWPLTPHPSSLPLIPHPYPSSLPLIPNPHPKA